MGLERSSPIGGGGPRAQRVVEGHARLLLNPLRRTSRECPSTILRMVPLPVPGRIS